jgi:hypothetical protein
MPFEGEAWGARFTDLANAGSHHAKEEENEPTSSARTRPNG